MLTYDTASQFNTNIRLQITTSITILVKFVLQNVVIGIAFISMLIFVKKIFIYIVVIYNKNNYNNL